VYVTEALYKSNTAFKALQDKMTHFDVP